MKNRKLSFSTTHIILFSFVLLILIGAVLLMLPISTRDGKGASFTDALFTAATSACVTGLTVETTATYFSNFGHAVILVLIQIGGLGVITVMTGIAMFMNKKLGLSDRMLIQDAFNLNTLSGIVLFIKKVLIGTLIVEGLGALLYMTVFIPQYGIKGIWYSVFTAVSAFCNAGLDIIASDSLCSYALNPVINLVTVALIVIGGIGYIVWWDVIRVIRLRRSSRVKIFKSLTLHSKIAITTTLVLILVGAACIFAFEYNNPLTMKDMSLPQKLQASLFQSVTTRTAGFFTVSQEGLTGASVAVSLVLMFIGGSPVGTAGGVKTVTFAVFAAVLISVIRDKNETSVFGRTISARSVKKAVAVCSMSFAIMFVSTAALSAVMPNMPLADLLYETVSATATVGLSRGVTPFLNDIGKLIITATMYFGRVGPISLAMAMSVRKKNKNLIKEPTEEISIG